MTKEKLTNPQDNQHNMKAFTILIITLNVPKTQMVRLKQQICLFKWLKN